MSPRKNSGAFCTLPVLALAALAALVTAGCSGAADVPDGQSGQNGQSGHSEHSEQSDQIAQLDIRCGSEASGAEHQSASEPPPAMGLMTSLPLTYPIGADLGAFARGEVRRNWQAVAIGQCYTAVPLDTLSPIPALDPAASAIDPLDGLEYLAVIQPRGLSPRDNVALDNWVRAGGQLLLMLDPMLTGEYDLPLGDPRRPAAAALIPPVVRRWGMEVTYDEAQAFAPRLAIFGDLHMPMLLAGDIIVSEGDCLNGKPSPIQRCQIGEGSVTVVADAAIFEDADFAGPGGDIIHDLFALAFER